MVSEQSTANLPRRFGAIFYDSFLIIALLFVVSIPAVIMNGGEISSDGSLISELKQWIFFTCLLFSACSFYAWFWTHGGQTLGMAAWHIYVVDQSGQPLRWRAAFIRSLTACFGLANFSTFFSKKSIGWHEKISNSRTIHKPKNK